MCVLPRKWTSRGVPPRPPPAVAAPSAGAAARRWLSAGKWRHDVSHTGGLLSPSSSFTEMNAGGSQFLPSQTDRWVVVSQSPAALGAAVRVLSAGLVVVGL